ncbi:alpha/beta fold hydrolase [Bdellovibrio sp. HCB2-146]|uniref:alpha/beta fold hydrolase n=1 Tax=Bdellovibrio sp. HCB2-146 TaxID=3394362 RepID=UPI0039BD8CD7
MKSLFTLLTFAVASSSFSQTTQAPQTQQAPQILVHDQYRSAQELYDHVMKSPDGKAYPLKIKGEFLRVPLNYKKTSDGAMSVYYRLSPNFDPKKPTVLFFYGGPGGNSWYSSQYENLKEVNFLYFDQRGTGFSKPDTLEQLQNTDYFTSEFVAADAVAILKKLNIKKVTAYGHSYGTVVATIFASKYPQLTNNLILEGVVFDGSEDLWANAHRRKLLNSFYRDLSDEQKDKIQKFTAREDVPDTWLSALAQTAMYDRNYEPQLIRGLNEFIDTFDPKASNPIFSREQFLFTESIYYGGYFFHQIACKELSRMHPEATFGSILTKEGKFIPAQTGFGSVCLTLKNFTTAKIKMYSAKNYPVKVPTTYFQGTTDGATAPPNAIRHYEQAAKGNAQLILVTKHGHSPMASCLNREENGCPAAYTDLFMTAVRGEPMTQAQLNDITTTEHKWAGLQKWK